MPRETTNSLQAGASAAAAAAEAQAQAQGQQGETFYDTDSGGSNNTSLGSMDLSKEMPVCEQPNKLILNKKQLN